MTLTGCELDFEHALVGDETGYERLVDRLEGTSRALRPSPPTWTEVLAPLTSPALRRAPARVVLVLAEPEVVAWVNRLERASDTDRLRQRTSLVGLQRWRNLGRVQGLGAKDQGEVQRALGRAVAPAPLVLRQGVVPAAEVPREAMILGLLGLVASLWSWVARARASPAGDAGLDVGDVKLELGQLEALRKEKGKPGQHRGP